jgi:ADP-ribose pyrophosphatase YjhB (NUDIX family)
VYFDPKVAVVVFIEQAEQVLLIRRGIEPSKGLWALPAGFIEQEEPPAEAAIRETYEETGLLVAVTRLLDVFPKRDNGAANIVIAYAAQVVGGTLHAGDDAEQVGWFARDQIPELAFYPSKTLIARWQQHSL